MCYIEPKPIINLYYNWVAYTQPTNGEISKVAEQSRRKNVENGSKNRERYSLLKCIASEAVETTMEKNTIFKYSMWNENFKIVMKTIYYELFRV